MKSIVFDSGPIINLALNNLLWILKPLKEKFKGEFYITNSVKRECIDRPLTSKKFKYEALETLKILQEGTIKVYDSKTLNDKTKSLLKSSNSIFQIHGHYIKNVQYAEVEAIVALQELNANAVVIDEFVTRALLENPLSVKKRMERKMHANVYVDKNNLDHFIEKVANIPVIRSFELVAIAFELDLFEDFYLDIDNPKKTLLDALLWAVKLNGCSLTENEINQAKKIIKT
jgi:hypothetical protein